jgi:hypothetical protein
MRTHILHGQQQQKVAATHNASRHGLCSLTLWPCSTRVTDLASSSAIWHLLCARARGEQDSDDTMRTKAREVNSETRKGGNREGHSPRTRRPESADRDRSDRLQVTRTRLSARTINLNQEGREGRWTAMHSARRRQCKVASEKRDRTVARDRIRRAHNAPMNAEMVMLRALGAPLGRLAKPSSAEEKEAE